MIKAGIIGLALLTAPYSFAADPVTDAMQKAYVPYRAALFKTNSKSQPESKQTITQAQHAWSELKNPLPIRRQPGYLKTPQL